MTERFETDNQTGRVTTDYDGRLAQLVERTLSMREVEGSKPLMSNNFFIMGYSIYSFSIVISEMYVELKQYLLSSYMSSFYFIQVL